MKNSIAKLRKEKGLSQQKLANEVGVSRTTIYNLEAGKFLPSLKLAMLIANILDININKIFELEFSDKVPKQE